MLIYNMKQLTKAEEQVMHILWEIKKGFVKDMLEKMPNPKPAYNTVSTIVRILERKGFVSSFRCPMRRLRLYRAEGD